MFDFDNVLELMKKYGYSSTSVHPYIYQNGDSLGICYTYIDDEYGLLERIKIFEDMESFEYFLKQLDFLKTNGKNYNIRMVLDNYESMNPKVVFLRNDKIMVEGEMFDISSFDLRENQRSQLDRVTQVVYKAGDLLLVYDEVKGRQLQYLKNIVSLKNTLRTKYFELQKEIDTYNKYKVERVLNLLPDVRDIGINDTMEIAIKDRYNMYIAQTPSYEEAVDFLKEVWDLNKNLELNSKYYEAQKEENDTRNEIRVVDEKLALMKKLNEDYKPLFGIDLVSRFRKINKKFNLINNSIADEVIQENIERVERKYAVYDRLDILATSDYLREAMQNTNYEDLALKYSTASNKNNVITNKLPLNEVAASLSIQYRDRLDISEQAIMVLYNNHKYRKLCNALLEIEGFETLPIKKVVNKLNGLKGFSKIKTECYDIVKKRIDDPVNASVKMSLFNGFDFTSFESFISSLIQGLVKLRSVNNKMVINGNINMYLQVKNVNDINGKKFVLVTNDLNGLLNETKENHGMIGIVLLKANTPVLYSPYYFDVGDIYNKDASLQMYIKEMINFELLVEISDITINIDPVKTNVVRYYSEPVVSDNVSIVSDIMMSYKTTFCKYAFTNNLPVMEESVPQVVVNPPSLEEPVREPSNISNEDPALSIFESVPVVEPVPVVEGNTVVNPVPMVDSNIVVDTTPIPENSHVAAVSPIPEGNHAVDASSIPGANTLGEVNSVSVHQGEGDSVESDQSNKNESVSLTTSTLEEKKEEEKDVNLSKNLEVKTEEVTKENLETLVQPVVGAEVKESVSSVKEKVPTKDDETKENKASLNKEESEVSTASNVVTAKNDAILKENRVASNNVGEISKGNGTGNPLGNKVLEQNKTVVTKAVEVKPVPAQAIKTEPNKPVVQKVVEAKPVTTQGSKIEPSKPVVQKSVEVKTVPAQVSKVVPTAPSGQVKNVVPLKKVASVGALKEAPVQKQVSNVAPPKPVATIKEPMGSKVVVPSVSGPKVPTKAVVVSSVGAPKLSGPEASKINTIEKK